MHTGADLRSATMQQLQVSLQAAGNSLPVTDTLCPAGGFIGSYVCGGDLCYTIPCISRSAGAPANIEPVHNVPCSSLRLSYHRDYAI